MNTEQLREVIAQELATWTGDHRVAVKVALNEVMKRCEALSQPEQQQDGKPEVVAWLVQPNEKSHQGLEKQLCFHRPVIRADWEAIPLYRLDAADKKEQPPAPAQAMTDEEILYEFEKITGIELYVDGYMATHKISGDEIVEFAQKFISSNQRTSAQAMTDKQIDLIMAKAQEFASAWSLVGGQFDNGEMLESAESVKAELRALLSSNARPSLSDEQILLKWDAMMRGVTVYCTNAQIVAFSREILSSNVQPSVNAEAAVDLAQLVLAKAEQDKQAELKEMEARKDAAYLERNQVVAALAKCFPSGVAKTEIEGWSEDWQNCVYIDLPTGQASWHFHDSHIHLFADLPPYKGTWDGHTTEKKYVRLEALTMQSPAPVRETPIDMILHCPACGLQHVDEPEHHDVTVHGVAVDRATLWNNPPHRSHLCHRCGHIWRPADVPTNGVKAIKTKGKADSQPTLADPPHSEQQEPFMYAIQGPDGKAHFDDLCCAPNPEDLENEDGN